MYAKSNKHAATALRFTGTVCTVNLQPHYIQPLSSEEHWNSAIWIHDKLKTCMQVYTMTHCTADERRQCRSFHADTKRYNFHCQETTGVALK